MCRKGMVVIMAGTKHMMHTYTTDQQVREKFCVTLTRKVSERKSNQVCPLFTLLFTQADYRSRTVTGHTHQLSVKLALRFSANAAMPSRRSSVPNDAWKSFFSSRHPSASDSS